MKSRRLEIVELEVYNVSDTDLARPQKAHGNLLGNPSVEVDEGDVVPAKVVDEVRHQVGDNGNDHLIRQIWTNQKLQIKMGWFDKKLLKFDGFVYL